MKNFDESRRGRQATREDRTFQLGGETFLLKAAIRPEVLIPYDDIKPDSSTEETLKVLDGLIIDIIEPIDDAGARWHAIRGAEGDPIEMVDILDVVQWATEVYTARPTGRPSDSGSGPSLTGTSSTDASSSPVTPMGVPV